MTQVLVIGIGNEFRKDDGVGPLAAQKLRELDIPGVSILEAMGEGTTLMELWKGAEAVFLIDAVRSGQTPGTILRIDASETTIPPEYFAFSTHAFGVAEAIDMARALNGLPPKVIVYGVEGKVFEQGLGLSESVAKSVIEVVRRLGRELAELEA